MSKKVNTVEDRDFKVVRITIDEQSGGKPKADTQEAAIAEMAQIPILEDPDCDCADKTANSLDEASIITLAGSVLEAGDHRDKLPGQLQALRHVVEILFLKPEQEGLDESYWYDMRSGDDQRLFYILKKAPLKFLGRCDIHVVDRDTEESFLRLISSKLNPYKLVVKQRDAQLLGVVTQTNWVLCLPRFVIRDATGHEIAIIRTKFELNTCCINCPQCCCQLTSGMFEVFRRKDPSTGTRLTKEIKLGTIGRIDHDDDEEETAGGLLGINFEYDDLEVDERSLIVAATLFLDFNLFGNMKPTSPYCILFGILFLILVIVLGVVGFIHL